MIDEDDLLRSLRHERPPTEVHEVVRAGRRRIHRRRRLAGIVTAAAVVLAVGAGATVVDGDDAEDVVAATVELRTIEHVAVSRGFGADATLLGLVVDRDGSLWAAWAGQGIYRFDDDLRMTLAIEDVDPDLYARGITITGDGTIVGWGWTPSTSRDDHGNPLMLRSLSEIARDGTATTIAMFGDPVEPSTGASPVVAMDDVVYVAIGDRVWSQRLHVEGIDAARATSASQPVGTIRSISVDRDGSLWVTDGESVVRLLPDLTRGPVVPWPGATEAVAVGDATWVLGDGGGSAERIDRSAATEDGPFGDPSALGIGSGVLWAHSPSGVTAYDAATGEIVAGHEGRWIGSFVAHGNVAWVQDEAGGGVLRRLELRPLDGPAQEAGMATVPDVIGVDVEVALDRLAAVGVTGVVEVTDVDRSPATVLAQEPPAGTRMSKNDVVGLRTVIPDPPEALECDGYQHPHGPSSADALPAVDGVTREAAESAVRSLPDGLLARWDRDAYEVVDGDVVVRHTPGFHAVVVADPGCSVTPTFVNGVPVTYVRGPLLTFLDALSR